CHESATRLCPPQVLTAIQRDHLPGQCWSIQDEADGLADLFGCRGTLKRHVLPLGGEVLFALTVVLQGRAGADAVDPDPWRQRHRQSLGEGPEAGFAER